MDRKLIRRAVAGLLIVAGAALLWLSPETLPGFIALVAGLAVEAIGIALEHA